MLSKNFLIKIFTFLLLYILYYMFDFGGSFLVALTVGIVLVFVKEKNPAHAFWSIAFTSFIFYPFFLSLLLGSTGVNYDLYINILFIYIFILCLNNKDVIDFSGFLNIPVWIYGLLCGICFLILFFLPYWFHFLISAFLLWLLISNENKNSYKFFIKFIFYMTYYALFIAFIWDGFGRLILFAYVFLPIYIYLVRYNFPVLKISLFFNIVLMPLMSLVRYGRLEFETMLTDSSVSAFFLLNEIYEKIKNNNLFSVDLSGFFNQFILLFISFIPRDLFPSKPIGFGRLYVEKEMNTYQYSDEHSIAATLFGDPLYYLGLWLWIPFSVFIIYILVYFYFYLKKMKSNLDVVFLIFIPTLVWGGMASFSSRFLFLFLFLWFLSGFLIPRRYFR
ncbi:hypothetical protein VXR69_05870 [Acinetobacter baumannii]|uniref:hypothetical protein n=1 Tax=Acinetobacter baumannii TaxID=470 RepID=UPI0037DE8797